MKRPTLLLGVPLGLALAAFAAGCTKTPEPDAASGKPQNALAGEAPTGAKTDTASRRAAPQDSASPNAPAEASWDAPARWQKADNPSPMRKATYKIPKATGDAEDAEMSVSQAGGTVDMNLKRWVGQFEAKSGEPKISEKRVGDVKVTVIEVHGTFNGGGMPGQASAGAPKENYALLGAIVETTMPTFFKITGPEKTVVSARAEFEKMLENLRFK